MLNNDFNILVQKYERYKKQKTKKRNRRVIFILIIGMLTYYISTLDFSQPTRITTPDTNKTTKQPEKVNTPPTKELIDNTVKEKENVKEIVEKEKIIEQDKPKKIKKKVKKSNKPTLKVTTKEKSLYQLLENQARLKSYSSTIAVANFHYSKKEYQKAVKWAIEASKKNKSKVRPWIVYAKSKKALGKTGIAKKALTLFLKKYQSQEVEQLLNSL